LRLFDESEREPTDRFRMQFEALGHFHKEEKRVVKALLDSLILKQAHC
jgi:hypothetical protein